MNSFVKINKFYCQKFIESEEIVAEKPNPRIGFKSLHYTVIENVGSFTVTICKKVKDEITVGIRTVDGSAKGGDDYLPIYEVIKVSYLEYKLEVHIVDDDEIEPEEDFFIELFDPKTKKRLIGEDSLAKVTIVDEAKAPVIGFKDTQFKVHPRELYVSLKVLRTGDCKEKASIFY